LRLVLDSNEYIFAFGPVKADISLNLLEKLLDTRHSHIVRLPRTIFDEVRRNLSPEYFYEFMNFIKAFSSIDEDFLIPFELGVKYEIRGFKMADAFIAAYTEWVGADVLVTENRHFLKHNPDLPFKVLTADKCLKIIS
jgi:hypothetical protein